MLVEKSKTSFGVETLVIHIGEITIIEQIYIAHRAAVTMSILRGVKCADIHCSR